MIIVGEKKESKISFDIALHCKSFNTKMGEFSMRKLDTKKLRMRIKIISTMQKLSVGCRLAAYSYLYIVMFYILFGRYK